MTVVEEQLTHLLHERAVGARPEPDLAGVLAGDRRFQIIVIRPRRTPSQRLLNVAAAIVAVGGSGVVVASWLNVSHTRPASHPPQIAYPDRVPEASRIAPAEAPPFWALVTSPDGSGLTVQKNAASVPLSGAEAGTPDASPWATWPIDGQTLTDVDFTTPGGSYLATCCADGGTIWRNGSAHATGTRIDYLLDGVLQATVDPATATARVGDVVLHIPGVLDVSILDRRSAVVLVDEPDPHLLVLVADEFSATAEPSRRTVELPSGTYHPCAIVALDQGILVLAGRSIGPDQCVSDRGFIVDPDTGSITGAIRLPTDVRAINSDHNAHVIAVTTAGDVMIGEFDTQPAETVWFKVLEGDYLAASLRIAT